MNFSLLSFEGSRRGQSGNVFFAIFGAVVLVGLLGSAVMTFMKGPLATSVKLTKMNTAENQMAIGSQVAVMATASQLNNGDCDSDGYVEPVEWRTPTTEPVPVNGGLVPLSLGISKKDPWGTEYGYCVWNHGATTSGSGCAANMLTGATSNAYTVVALVSAGPDKTFTTTCRSFATADVNTDGDLLDAGDLPMVSKAVETDDDIIVSYTYEEATGASGGLWSIKAGDPATATIGTKNIETTGVASLQGGLLLPDKALIDCNDVTNAGVMAKNGNAIEICDGAGTWTAITGGGGGTIDALTDAITDYATLYNVFLGDLTGVNTTTGTSNTALGYNALNTNVAKGGNTAIGYEAMRYTDSAVAVTSTNNTALGYQALKGSAVAANNTGTLNTAIGSGALRSYTSGYQNTAVGYGVLKNNNTGYQNTGVGAHALGDNTSGALNTAIGSYALAYNLTGSYNTAVGYVALKSNTGAWNTAIGLSALEDNLGGNSSTAIGYNAMKLNTTGDNNTAMGHTSLYENRAGEQSVAIGYEAMRYANSTAVADTVTYNTAIGYQALMGSATPASNTGIHNTAIGHQALRINAAGNSNIAAGTGALYTNSGGDYNIAIGYQALFSNGSGAGNAAIGYQALYNNSVGNNNVAIGKESSLNTTGSNNVSAGIQSLLTNTTGNNNIAIGYAVASTTLSTGSDNILIGTSSAVDAPAAATSNHLNIGNTIYGDLANDLVRIGGTDVPSAFSDLELAGTLAVKVSSGTTAQRPATPDNGMVRYNTTTGKIEGYENGSWVNLGSTACLDMTPDAMTFPNLTEQTVSTLVTSDIVQAANIACDVPVSISAVSGAPEYRVCTDAACATVTQTWTTTSTYLTPNQYIQMRITTGAGAAEASTANLLVGSHAVTWTVITAGDCTEPSPAVGTICADGSVYAGLSPDGSVKMYVPRCNYGQTWGGSSCIGVATTSSWNNGVWNSSDSPLINCGSAPACSATGESNTTTLVAADSNSSPGIQPHNAANACDGLNIHGQTDWYLPSIAELELMYRNRLLIGGFTTADYWSSSEYVFDAGAGGFTLAWRAIFSNGGKASEYKNNLLYIRCARK